MVGRGSFEIQVTILKFPFESLSSDNFGTRISVNISAFTGGTHRDNKLRTASHNPIPPTNNLTRGGDPTKGICPPKVCQGPPSPFHHIQARYMVPVHGWNRARGHTRAASVGRCRGGPRRRCLWQGRGPGGCGRAPNGPPAVSCFLPWDEGGCRRNGAITKKPLARLESHRLQRERTRGLLGDPGGGGLSIHP